MAQFFHYENVMKLTLGSTTTVNLPAGSNLRVGGQGRFLTSALTCSTGASGFGGIDTGAIAASSFYYVYVVVDSGGIIGLVASLSALSPTGFLSWRKVGAFYTNATSQVFKTYYFGEVNRVLYSFRGDGGSPSVVTEDDDDVVNGNGTRPATGNFTYTWNAGIFAADPSMTTLGATGTSGSEGTGVTAVTLTSGTARISANGSPANKDHYVFVKKQGIDAVQPDWNRD